MSLKDMQKGPLRVAGVSVLMLAAMVWMAQSSDKSKGREGEGARSSTGRAGFSSEGTNESARRVRRSSFRDSRLDASLSRHDTAKLVNFILSEVEGRNVTLQKALSILKEAYQDACHQSCEKALDLKFRVEDAPDFELSFSLKGRSFIACVNHLAALAGLEARLTETTVELSRGVTAEQAAELSIQKYQSAMSRLRELAGQDPASMEKDWEALLRSSGFIREQGTTFAEGKDGFLMIHGSNAEIARVKSALELATQPGRQIKLATKLIETDFPIEIDDSNLTPVEQTALMRELASRAGTTLTTEPSITAQDGENATMEIIREKVVGNQTDWTGLKHEINCTHAGLKIVGTDRSEKRPENADGSGWLAENDFALYTGETHVQLVASGNGIYRYRLLTASTIDATGRPVIAGETPEEDIVFTYPDAPGDSGSHPTAGTVPGKEGFVFSPFNNRVVDVRGIPSGGLVQDPTYPVSEKRYFRVP